jgi:hypothetical protein
VLAEKKRKIDKIGQERINVETAEASQDTMKCWKYGTGCEEWGWVGNES